MYHSGAFCNLYVGADANSGQDVHQPRSVTHQVVFQIQVVSRFCGDVGRLGYVRLHLPLGYRHSNLCFMCAWDAQCPRRKGPQRRQQLCRFIRVTGKRCFQADATIALADCWEESDGTTSHFATPPLETALEQCLAGRLCSESGISLKLLKSFIQPSVCMSL